MSDLYDETPGKLVIFIRYNPHKYSVPQGKLLVNNSERKELLLSTLKTIIKNNKKLNKEHSMYVFYICYSENNDILAKNIPKKMIYETEDLDKN